jgi:predicted DNA-binding transcriptional regulator YafY
MYQYSRAIYRSIKDLIDPYSEPGVQLESRRAVLEQCEQTMERLAADPHYFAKPDRALFQDIRRFFPITAQAQVAWAVKEGVGAAVGFIEEQLEAGALDGGVARCRATTRKGKPCQRTPLPERDLPVTPASRTLARRGVTGPRRPWRAAAAGGTVRRYGPQAGRRSGTRLRRRQLPGGRQTVKGRRGHLAALMSHDTDKLIRQLSLVAFLMAERRPLTARDVKGNVEGYSEMSDEAFARRFYSDRAELIALGVPLHSQRDEFTGEELYTLRSENYFLDKLELDDDELAALQTALHMLDGTFAYAEPLRLALQNLALGRPGFDDAPTETAASVQVRDPDYSPEMAGRLSKLESAISKQRTIKFSYWSPRRDAVRERSLNPYALRRDRGTWYVVGEDLDHDDVRTFRVSRIRSDIRFATRRERDFRVPPDFDVDAFRVGEDWQHGPVVGTARIEVNGDTAWWVHRSLSEAGTLTDGVFETEYAAIEPLAGWVLRQNGRAIPLEPEDLRRACAEGLKRVREAHEAEAPKPARPKSLAIVADAIRPHLGGSGRFVVLRRCSRITAPAAAGASQIHANELARARFPAMSCR